MNYYLSVLKNYAKFSGRARRAEYWWFHLVNLGVMIFFVIVSAVIHTQIPFAIYYLATLIPTIVVAVRRIHDTDHAWWAILIPFYNLYLTLLAGTEGPNRFGVDPKATDVTAEASALT